MTRRSDLSECPVCARGICSACGRERGGLSRYYLGEHECKKCDAGPELYRLVPTRHRQAWRHREHVADVAWFESKGMERRY